jgi:molybdopterin-synthase adenylyltransferase
MNRLDRQSFLGANSGIDLSNSKIGLVGVGGGGSHLAQQLAHLGIGNFVVCDPQSIDWTNTNRLIGGTLADVHAKAAKVDISKRVIHSLEPTATVRTVKGSWIQALKELRDCDIIVGGVDSFSVRDQLERFARRNLILYVDLGIDVLEIAAGRFFITGQVIVSMPDEPCLWCCNFLSSENLKREAELYGAAGPRAQIVWANGVLASISVGLITQLLTPWFDNKNNFQYLEYDGNRSTVSQSVWMKQLAGHKCTHHPLRETGDPLFDLRKMQVE